MKAQISHKSPALLVITGQGIVENIDSFPSGSSGQQGRETFGCVHLGAGHRRAFNIIYNYVGLYYYIDISTQTLRMKETLHTLLNPYKVCVLI